MYKALSGEVIILTVADVCMLYFEIEISQTQGQNRSHCQDIHYLPEIVDPMPG